MTLASGASISLFSYSNAGLNYDSRKTGQVSYTLSVASTYNGTYTKNYTHAAGLTFKHTRNEDIINNFSPIAENAATIGAAPKNDVAITQALLES